MTTHTLVTAEVELSAARARVRLEKLRSDRNALSTAAGSNHGRAMTLGKQIKQAERIHAAWDHLVFHLRSLEGSS